MSTVLLPYALMILDQILQDHHLKDLGGIYHELSLTYIAVSAPHRSELLKVENL